MGFRIRVCLRKSVSESSSSVGLPRFAPDDNLRALRALCGEEESVSAPRHAVSERGEPLCPFTIVAHRLAPLFVPYYYLSESCSLAHISDRQKRKSLRYKYLVLTQSHQATEFGRHLGIPLLRVFVSLCESILGCGRRPRWAIHALRCFQIFWGSGLTAASGKMLARKTRCCAFAVQRGLAGLGRNPKPLLAPRRKERQEDITPKLLAFAILASLRET